MLPPKGEAESDRGGGPSSPGRRNAMRDPLPGRARCAGLLALVLVISASPGALAGSNDRPADDPPASAADTPPALSPQLDADGDGWADALEAALGSGTADPGNTPESVAIPESCIDGADNDGDGSIDDADDGCQPPQTVTDAFPAAGEDIFASTLKLDGYELATQVGVCPISLSATGPVVVRRGAPAQASDGTRGVDTEIVALQLSGSGILPAGTPCNPGATDQPFPATLVEDPDQASVGRIVPTGADGAADFPADSFFDVFFVVDTPLGVLQGGPPGGPAGAAVKVENVIRSIPPYHSPGNAAHNPDCYTVAGLPHEHCPKPPLDHFKCYSGDFPTFRPRRATLIDQFRSRSVRILSPDRLCNPVGKNGLRIFDEGAHLKRYIISDARRKPTFEHFRVPVRNQFGAQDLTLLWPAALLVPSQKNDEAPPAALDHFACYWVKGPEVGTTVSLVDQFDRADGRIEEVEVGAPIALCAPAVKTIGKATTPVGDPLSHLVCYSMVDKGFKARRVRVTNQLGRERVRLTAPAELCVPTLKGAPQPIEPPVIDLSTRRVKQGQTVDLTGHGFTPNGAIEKIIYRPDGHVSQAKTTADETGGFSGSLTIGPDDPAGTWFVQLYDMETGLWAQSTFRVRGGPARRLPGGP